MIILVNDLWIGLDIVLHLRADSQSENTFNQKLKEKGTPDQL